MAGLFTAGFPCQPFSSNGLQQGQHDEQGRGRVIEDIVFYLGRAPPKAFVLENVKGLPFRHPDYFDTIMDSLKSLTDKKGNALFAVKWKIMKTHKHGLGHIRERCYIVGTRRSAEVQPFKFPEETIF